MRAEHILLCLVGSATDDEALPRAAALADGARAQLSVVLGVVGTPLSEGCCGIQGQHWKRLLDDGSRAELQRAVAGLKGLGYQPVNADVQVGDCLADIVRHSAET